MRVTRELHAGVYRHYKGHLYLVLGYADDANTEGRTVVVYVGLQLDGAGPGARIKVRTAEDFFAPVNPSTGAVVQWCDGVDPAPVARFRYVGADVA
jgi:hypothetical protein